MSRILAIDYGKKRTGLAATDPMQIIASPLDTVATSDLWSFLKDYIDTEPVEAIVMGQPTHADGSPTYLQADITTLHAKLSKTYPHIPLHYQDESLTSAQAKAIIRTSGAKKKKRRDKSLVDKVSAVLILQRFLGHI